MSCNRGMQSVIYELKDEYGNGWKLKRLSKLGEGSYGIVYLVQCMYSDELLALKVIRKDRLNGYLKKRIIMEKDSHKMMKHKNVVQLYAYFSDLEFYYFLMEFVDGKNLNEIIETNGPFADRETRHIIRQLAEACIHIHSKRVIHRDLKLGNLILSRDGVLKVTDFGLATRKSLTGFNSTLVGTPNFVAPEVIKGMGHSFEADMWSFGVILYALLVGKPTFDTKSVNNSHSRLFEKIKRADFKFPRGIWVSPAAKDLIRKILNVNAEYRPSWNQILEHEWLRTDSPWQSFTISYPVKPSEDANNSNNNNNKQIETTHVGNPAKISTLFPHCVNAAVVSSTLFCPSGSVESSAAKAAGSSSNNTPHRRRPSIFLRTRGVRCESEHTPRHHFFIPTRKEIIRYYKTPTYSCQMLHGKKSVNELKEMNSIEREELMHGESLVGKIMAANQLENVVDKYVERSCEGELGCAYVGYANAENSNSSTKSSAFNSKNTCVLDKKSVLMSVKGLSGVGAIKVRDVSSCEAKSVLQQALCGSSNCYVHPPKSKAVVNRSNYNENFAPNTVRGSNEDTLPFTSFLASCCGSSNPHAKKDSVGKTENFEAKDLSFHTVIDAEEDVSFKQQKSDSENLFSFLPKRNANTSKPNMPSTKQQEFLQDLRCATSTVYIRRWLFDQRYGVVFETGRDCVGFLFNDSALLISCPNKKYLFINRILPNGTRVGKSAYFCQNCINYSNEKKVKLFNWFSKFIHLEENILHDKDWMVGINLLDKQKGNRCEGATALNIAGGALLKKKNVCTCGRVNVDENEFDYAMHINAGNNNISFVLNDHSYQICCGLKKCTKSFIVHPEIEILIWGIDKDKNDGQTHKYLTFFNNKSFKTFDLCALLKNEENENEEKVKAEEMNEANEADFVTCFPGISLLSLVESAIGEVQRNVVKSTPINLKRLERMKTILSETADQNNGEAANNNNNNNIYTLKRTICSTSTPMSKAQSHSLQVKSLLEFVSPNPSTEVDSLQNKQKSVYCNIFPFSRETCTTNSTKATCVQNNVTFSNFFLKGDTR